jgi:NlpC/P60 family
LQPGDLVFFNTLKRTFSHVGIYVGNNKFIHSPKPGAGVRVESMGISYWQTRFNGARRVVAAQFGANAPVATQALPSVQPAMMAPFSAPALPVSTFYGDPALR